MYSKLNWYKRLKAATLILGFIILSGCAAQETHKIVETRQVASANTPYSGEKAPLVVGKFDNRSNYLQGLFSSGNDRLGSQAKTILKSHLQQTGRFSVMDRENMEEGKREAALIGRSQNIKGARYALSGAVSEFGRKQTGDKQLFGIVGSGKTQIAYARVTLNVVDVLSSEIVHSVNGAGEYSLSNREVVGFGSTASYDATLNGKVLDLAITEAVNNLVNSIEAGKWSPKQ